MKKFEEELNYLIELSGKVLTGQIEAEEFEKHRVLFIKEQQAKIDELTEKNQLYFENLCENIAAMKDVANKMRDLSQENESLKSQLKKEKPEIPEVPQFVADWLDRTPLYAINGSISVEVIEWAQKQTGYADLGMNISHLLKLKVNSYTVAKEKRFYLKNKLTGGYIAQDCYNGMRETYNRYDRTAFTQQEIDSMETGSYEQIEVEE